MPPRERRLEKARQNPRNVRFEDLCKIYEDHGFIIRSGKGSHYRAFIPGTEISNTFPRPHGGHMRIQYVKTALNSIDEGRALGFIREELDDD